MTKKLIDIYGIIAMSILILMALIPNVSAQAEALCCGGTFCLIYIVMFIVWIMVAIWVYKDAESKGQSGVLWLIVVLVGNIVGLIVYLIVRSGWPEYPPSTGYPYGYSYGYPYGHPYGYPPSAYRCHACGAPLTFVQQYNRWFCYVCQRYL